MKRLLLLTMLALGCGPDLGDELRDDYRGQPVYYGGEVLGLEMRCAPECPDALDVADRLVEIEAAWAPHMGATYQHFSALEGARVLWHADHPQPGAAGVHYRYERRIEIWWGVECPQYPQGLCRGVFDYEVGHLYMMRIDPNATEREWLEWRRDRGLL